MTGHEGPPREQIEEMLHDLNDVVIWSRSDPEIDRIMPVIYWLEVELKEEKAESKRMAYNIQKKLGVDKTN